MQRLSGARTVSLYEMKKRMMRQWIGMCLAAVLCVAGLRAQEEGEPGAAFGGGQMVRGMVTSSAGNRLTVKTDAGDLYQITVTDNTRLIKDRQPVRIADVKVGDGVGAMGVLDAPTKTVHAMFLTVVDAEQAKKMREGLGKIYIMGKVTAIDELKLTIQRPDGVNQVIAVDEGTSFKRGGRGMQSMISGVGPVPGNAGPDGQPRRAGTGGSANSGGESITLADIKVGDSVGGRGEVKGGTFVPTELAVGDPSARQRRRRPEGANAEASQPSAPPRQ